MSTRDTVADVLQDALPMAPATAPRIDRATYERLARVAVKEGLEAWRG